MRPGDTIPAIRTTYQHIEFASRLEARWAVFWDCFSVEWEYEPERVRVEGLWYAPDFLVLNIPFIVPGPTGEFTSVAHKSMVVEIKPATSRPLTSEEGKKIGGYIKGNPNGILLVQGPPWDSEIVFYKMPTATLHRYRVQFGVVANELALFMLWSQIGTKDTKKPWQEWPGMAQRVSRACLQGPAAQAKEVAQRWNFDKVCKSLTF